MMISHPCQCALEGLRRSCRARERFHSLREHLRGDGAGKPGWTKLFDCRHRSFPWNRLSDRIWRETIGCVYVLVEVHFQERHPTDVRVEIVNNSSERYSSVRCIYGARPERSCRDWSPIFGFRWHVAITNHVASMNYE